MNAFHKYYWLYGHPLVDQIAWNTVLVIRQEWFFVAEEYLSHWRTTFLRNITLSESMFPQFLLLRKQQFLLSPTVSRMWPSIDQYQAPSTSLSSSTIIYTYLTSALFVTDKPVGPEIVFSYGLLGSRLKIVFYHGYRSAVYN